MKILLVQNAVYVPIHSGANKANRTLIEGLAAQGHTCHAVVPQNSLQEPQTQEQFIKKLTTQNMTVTFCSQEVTCFSSQQVDVYAVGVGAQLSQYVKEQAREFQPDWILVASEDPGQVLLQAALDVCPQKVVALVHSALVLPFGPGSFSQSAARTELFRRVAGIITVSNHLKDYIRRWSGCKAEKIPFPAYGEGPFPRYGMFDAGSVMMVNPCALKGLPIFSALVREMPDVPFAAVASWGTTREDRATLARFPNVEILEPTEQVEDLFAQMRILLVPSLWDEAFGMIVVEAMVRGIPVLASNAGGLAEAKLGVDYVLPVRPIERYEERLDSRMLPVPVVPEQDIQPWYEALQRLLTDRTHYEELASRSRTAALEYVASLKIAAFEEFLTGLASSTNGQEAAPQPAKQNTKSALKKNLEELSPERRALLAQRLKPKEKRGDVSSRNIIAPIPRVGVCYTFPLSFAQQRLWFLHQLAPESSAYNAVASYRLCGPLDVAIFERSLHVLISRHEVLRTSFVVEQKQPLQVICSTLVLPVTVIDLHTLPEPKREKEIQSLLVQEAQRPFVLEQSPLLRVSLIRQSSKEHRVLFTIHHIISDGWSMKILVQEWARLYQAFAEDRPSPLPALPIQYADYALWQRQWMQGEVLERQLTYWKKQLAGAPSSLELPVDASRSTEATSEGRTLSLEISAELTQEVRALCQRAGTTLFMTLLAAFKLLLCKWSGQSDIVVGTVVAERNRQETENLVGCFINFLALRSSLSGDSTCQALLEQEKAIVLDAYIHQGCPFEKVVEVLKPDRKPYQNPLYNVAFLLQNFALDSFSPINDQLQWISGISSLPSTMQHAPLDLRLIVDEVGQKLVVACEYNMGLFASPTIELLLQSYQMILEQWVRQPQVKLSQISIVQALQARSKQVREREEHQRMVIASTFTAEPVEASLAFWLKKLSLAWDIEFAPYNQLFQQLLDSSSLLSTNRRGINVLLLRLEDWRRNGQSCVDIAYHADEFLHALKTASRRTPSTYFIALCPLSEATQADQELKRICEDVAGHIVAEVERMDTVYLLDVSALIERYQVRTLFDPVLDEAAHIPFTQSFFTALGTTIVRQLYGLRKHRYKVIAIDCDNTLWKGICGEDGPMGIEINAPHRAFQEFLVAQYETGMLLCLCSRNNEQDVFEVFDNHPEMPLQREQLVGWRINWQNKEENLRSLAQQLRLGLDSFIFIDDDALVCAEIEAACPEVLMLQFSADQNMLAQILEHQWAFDHVKRTREDGQRTLFYQQESQRESLRQSTLTLESFLASLSVQIHIAPIEAEQIDRVAQLTQRTNQFNTTTTRRSVEEIQQLCERGECLVVEVSDRFGDYGLVGAMMFVREPDRITVDSFLLSCRSLGRGVEQHMLAHLGEIAVQQGIALVRVAYTPSAKNQPAQTFLARSSGKFEEDQSGAGYYEFSAADLPNLPQQPEQADERPTNNGEVKRPVASISTPDGQKEVQLLKEIAKDFSSVEQIERAITQVRIPKESYQTPWVAPQTPYEKMLSTIWAQVLGIERVGRNDNFFDLGGHSLLLIQVYGELRKQLEQDIAVVDLFTYPTVGSLAEYLSTSQEESQVPEMKNWAQKRTTLLERQRQQRKTRTLRKEKSGQK